MKRLFTATTNVICTAARYLIAPPFCAYCKMFLATDAPLCITCTALIQPITSITVPVTKKYPVTVFAVTNYQYPLKALILAKRWSNVVAATQLGELMWSMTYIRNVPFDYIVPIPLHWTRHAWRGYNQAEEIAHALSTKSGKPTVPLIIRSKRTHFQSSLPVAQRVSNVQNAFAVPEKYQHLIHGKHILLVDDLLTTSATITEATRALLPYKPAKVTVVVACRVV